MSDVPEIGGVYVVAFPLTDGSRSKRRPAVCVARTDPSNPQAIIVMAAVTSSQQRRNDAHTIAIGQWHEAGLDEESFVQADRLFSTQPAYLQGHLGKLSTSDVEKVLDAVNAVFVQRSNKVGNKSADSD